MAGLLTVHGENYNWGWSLHQLWGLQNKPNSTTTSLIVQYLKKIILVFIHFKPFYLETK